MTLLRQLFGFGLKSRCKERDTDFHAEASRSGKRLADGLFNRRGDGIEAAMENAR